MRTFFGLMVAVAIVGGFLKYRERPQPSAAPEISGRPAAAPGATPRHWPKSAIDRATDVTRQVAKEKSENRAP